MSDIIIREIKEVDNLAIAQVIKSVLIEYGAPKVGTAYEDKALDNMREAYSDQKSVYLVAELKGEVIGGAGIAPLTGYGNGEVCELQKMYLLPIGRGKGLGSKMMNACIEKAKEIGYEKCYLETMPYMDAARKLYKKTGFTDLTEPLGDTGHYSCSKWMIKGL